MYWSINNINKHHMTGKNMAGLLDGCHPQTKTRRTLSRDANEP